MAATLSPEQYFAPLDDAEDNRCRYVACEVCGGSGEIEIKPIVGSYEDPTPHAVLCAQCDGYGMDCVPTDPIEMDDLDGQQ